MRKNLSTIVITVSLFMFAVSSALLILSLSFAYQLGILDGGFGQISRNITHVNQLSQYAALLREIDNRFIGEFDIDELNIAAMRAAVDALDDEWSVFLTAEALEARMRSARNRYQGIGISVISDANVAGISVTRVHRGSPADVAGVMVGDVITHVDEVDISDYSLAEIISLMQRPLGLAMELTIIRGDEYVYTLFPIFDNVFTNPVEYEIFLNDIGYISLENFSAGAAEAFIEAVEYLLKNNVSAFIFDVRNNSGGNVAEMTGILDRLLPEGEIFVSVDRAGNEHVKHSDATMLDLPAVVLVDRNSFSAAEYFAAILSEYDFAYVVGEQTSGKGRMQTLHMLPGGNAVSLSTAEYLTKNRVSLHAVGGLTPDFVIDFTDEQRRRFNTRSLDRDDDVHIQKALYLLTIRDMQ